MKTSNYKLLHDRLEEILEQLQSAELDIDASLALHKEGKALIIQLEEYLSKAKNEIKNLPLGKK